MKSPASFQPELRQCLACVSGKRTSADAELALQSLPTKDATEIRDTKKNPSQARRRHDKVRQPAPDLPWGGQHASPRRHSGCATNPCTTLTNTGFYSELVSAPCTSALSTRRRSRRSVLVMMPIGLPSFTTGRHPIPSRIIRSTASPKDVSGDTVMTG